LLCGVAAVLSLAQHAEVKKAHSELSGEHTRTLDASKQSQDALTRAREDLDALKAEIESGAERLRLEHEHVEKEKNTVAVRPKGASQTDR
jgi:hypothetical protein